MVMQADRSQALQQIPDEVRHGLLWAHGRLRHLTRPHAQRFLYDQIHDAVAGANNRLTLAVMNCHRRLGKTFLLLLLALERLFGRPHQEVTFGAPTRDQARDIVRPLLQQILLHCPDELVPHRSGNHYTVRNPLWERPKAYSHLKLVGCNIDSGNRLRGQAADLVVLDEVREIPDLEYIVGHVLVHQFQGRKNPLLVMATTPPASMAHDFVQTFLPLAEEEGTYWCIPSSDNPDCTQEDRRIVLQMCGSEKTIAWRREMGCELVSDPKDLITPEFQEAKADIVVSGWPEPKHYQPYTIIDGAYKRDYLSIGWCYPDFHAQRLVFVDSVLLREKTLAQVAKAVREGEEELFRSAIDNGRRVRRRGDFTELELATLGRDFHLWIDPVEKHDKDSALASFRHMIQMRKLVIVSDPDEHGRPTRNVGLVRQLEHGVYNPGHTDYLRTSDMGHWDAGAMAVYASRMVGMKENPFPLQERVEPSTHHDAGLPADERRPALDESSFEALRHGFRIDP